MSGTILNSATMRYLIVRFSWGKLQVNILVYSHIQERERNSDDFASLKEDKNRGRRNTRTWGSNPLTASKSPTLSSQSS